MNQYLLELLYRCSSIQCQSCHRAYSCHLQLCKASSLNVQYCTYESDTSFTVVSYKSDNEQTKVRLTGENNTDMHFLHQANANHVDPNALTTEHPSNRDMLGCYSSVSCFLKCFTKTCRPRGRIFSNKDHW